MGFLYFPIWVWGRLWSQCAPERVDRSPTFNDQMVSVKDKPTRTFELAWNPVFERKSLLVVETFFVKPLESAYSVFWLNKFSRQVSSKVKWAEEKDGNVEVIWHRCSPKILSLFLYFIDTFWQNKPQIGSPKRLGELFGTHISHVVPLFIKYKTTSTILRTWI